MQTCECPHAMIIEGDDAEGNKLWNMALSKNYFHVYFYFLSK